MSIADKKNYVYNIIYRLSIIILPLVIIPYIARTLGASNVGLYTFSSTIACYFIMFAKLGLDNYGNRSIAFCRDDKEKRSEVFISIYIIQIISSLLSLLIYTLLIFTVFKQDILIYMIQFIYVLSALFDISWFFYGLEKFCITAIRSVISRVLIIIFVFCFVKSSEDLWIYALIMASSFILEQLFLFPFVFKYLKPVKFKKLQISVHILPNIKLFIPLLALSIYTWMDKLMLGSILKSTAVVAYYAYAENIITLPKGILSALDTVMMPKISSLVSSGQKDLAYEKMFNSIKINSFISSALCFGIAGLASVFVPWFLGDEYKSVIYLTIALSIVVIPMSITSVIQCQNLIPFSKEIIYIKAVTRGAIINLLLNILLIPFFGGIGAVIGTLGAELFVCFYEVYKIRDILKIKRLIKTITPFIICGLLELFVVYFLSYLPIKVVYLLAVQIISGGLVYIFSSLVYLIFLSKEFRNIKEVINFIKA